MAQRRVQLTQELLSCGDVVGMVEWRRQQSLECFKPESGMRVIQQAPQGPLGRGIGQNAEVNERFLVDKHAANTLA